MATASEKWTRVVKLYGKGVVAGQHNGAPRSVFFELAPGIPRFYGGFCMDVDRHRLRDGLSLAVLLVLIRGMSAQPAPTSPKNNFTAAPQQVGPGLYAIGKVTINQPQRTVSFPVRINQTNGVVEYAVVTTTGKTHESVFRTDASPQDVQVGMLLLGARPAGTNFVTRDGSSPVPGEPVSVELNWQAGDREVHRFIEEFIVTTNNARPLPEGPWIYNGSFVDYGTFVAQRDGSIVSIQEDASALINNPRPERTNDDLHYVNTSALPPADVALQLTIAFYKPKPQAEVRTNMLNGVITPITPPVYSPPTQPK